MGERLGAPLQHAKAGVQRNLNCVPERKAITEEPVATRPPAAKSRLAESGSLRFYIQFTCQRYFRGGAP